MMIHWMLHWLTMTHLNYKYKLREIAERGGNENCLNLFRTYGWYRTGFCGDAG